MIKESERIKLIYDKLLEINSFKSQVEFCNKIKYNKVSFSQVLNGDRNLPVRIKRNIVKTFKVNPNYIIKGSGNMFKDHPPVTRKIRATNLMMYGSPDDFTISFTDEYGLLNTLNFIK